MSQEPKDTVKYSGIWHVATVDGERVKLYSLTRWGMDKLENAASDADLQRTRTQLRNLYQVLHPILLANLKVELLKAMDDKAHFLKTLLSRVPNGNVYEYSLAFEAIRELVEERKVVDTKGHGWRKK